MTLFRKISLVVFLVGCAPPTLDENASEAGLGGPPAIGTNTTWVRTALAADTGEITAVAAGATIHTFYRGYDGTLWLSSDLAAAARVPGSPAIAKDGVAAAWDPSTSSLFVIVRTAAARAQVAQGRVGSTGITWSWIDLGGADGRPTLAVACGRVQVAIPAGGWIWLTDRSTSATAWSPGRALAQAPGAPVMAANNRQEAGLAVVGYDHNVYFWTSTCGATGPSLGAGVRLGAGGVQTADPRVGLAAGGPLFAVALRSLAGETWFLQQQLPLSPGSFAGAPPTVIPSWRGEFERVDPTPNGAIVSLADIPVVTDFRGLFVVAGRAADGRVIYYARTPNSLAPVLPRTATNVGWIGGFPVNADSLQTPPALVSVGDPGSPELKTELYAVAQSYRYEGRFALQPQKLSAVNLSRFMTLDFLEGHLNVRFDTRMINGVPKNQIENLFESLLAVLQTPSWAWTAFSLPTGTNVCDGGDTSRGITLFSWNQGFEQVVGCNVGLYYGAEVSQVGRSRRIWEELGHHILERTPLISLPGWHDNFDDLKPRACQVTADCGGEAGVSCLPIEDPGVGGWARSHATSARICIGLGLDHGSRPVGFTTDYGDNNTGHNWIYVAYYARWFGDDLRALAAQDAAAGDTRLQKKYEWVRDNFFGGQVFNGHLTDGDSDETEGTLGLPAR